MFFIEVYAGTLAAVGLHARSICNAFAMQGKKNGDKSRRSFCFWLLPVEESLRAFFCFEEASGTASLASHPIAARQLLCIFFARSLICFCHNIILSNARLYVEAKRCLFDLFGDLSSVAAPRADLSSVAG
jgi:hypothetical protein